MRPLALVLGAVAVTTAAQAAFAQTAPFEGAPVVTDATLADTSGGFLLPNGMDVRLGITIDTLIDGRPVLSTVLTLDDASHLMVYTGGDVKQQATGTAFLVPGPNGPALVRIAQDTSFARGAGGQPIAVVPNGGPIQTNWGAVRLEQSDAQSTVFLAGEGIDLRHMIGTATGALVANTANDRVIDTMVTIDIDVRNSAIPTGAMMLRLDALLAGAATRGGY